MSSTTAPEGAEDDRASRCARTSDIRTRSQSPAPSSHPPPRAHITRSWRAAEARADRATDTAISVVSSHTGSSDSAADRTFGANGTTTAGVSPSKDAPVGVRAGGADLPVLGAESRSRAGQHHLPLGRQDELGVFRHLAGPPSMPQMTFSVTVGPALKRNSSVPEWVLPGMPVSTRHVSPGAEPRVDRASRQRVGCRRGCARKGVLGIPQWSFRCWPPRFTGFTAADDDRVATESSRGLECGNITEQS